MDQVGSCGKWTQYHHRRDDPRGGVEQTTPGKEQVVGRTTKIRVSSRTYGDDLGRPPEKTTGPLSRVGRAPRDIPRRTEPVTGVRPEYG